MNTRRSFFKDLALGLTALTIAPSILIPKAKDSFKWKALQSSGLYVINPAWIDAPFEIMFYSQVSYGYLKEGSIQPIIFKRGETKPDGIIYNPYPARFLHPDAKQQVPQYIKL